MTGQLNFGFDKDAIRQHVRAAAHRALERLSLDAHAWWLVVVPIGQDRPGHRAGELRDSWFAVVIDKTTGTALIFGARTRYAIFVELGTTKMAPRAPLRTTAGEIAPFIGTYVEEELAV